jgi:hypothetical protein
MDVLFLWIMIGYGMTSIIVWGSIFESTRDFIKKRSKFFGDLISCTLCTATWVGFFLSILLGGLTNYFYEIPWYICLFTDGMFTAGSVWMVNTIIEFFEESRIK